MDSCSTEAREAENQDLMLIEELESRFEMTAITATPAAQHPQPDICCACCVCCGH